MKEILVHRFVEFTFEDWAEWYSLKRMGAKQSGWEFLRHEDGTYAVFRLGKLLKDNIPERWFYEQICADYGFCGVESDEIRRQIDEFGRCTMLL